MAVRIKKGTVMQQLPVVPLVDTLLNLLIFFLVTTKFAEVDRAMEAALADADAAKPVSAALGALYIDIDAQGRCYAGGSKEPVGPDELYRLLRTAWINNPQVSATIRADKRCRWQFVVGAMNVCRKAKVHYDVAAQVAGKPVGCGLRSRSRTFAERKATFIDSSVLTIYGSVPLRPVTMASQHRIADFDEQLWPINYGIMTLGGLLAGFIVAKSSFADPRLTCNGWAGLAGVALMRSCYWRAACAAGQDGPPPPVGHRGQPAGAYGRVAAVGMRRSWPARPQRLRRSSPACPMSNRCPSGSDGRTSTARRKKSRFTSSRWRPRVTENPLPEVVERPQPVGQPGAAGRSSRRARARRRAAAGGAGPARAELTAAPRAEAAAGGGSSAGSSCSSRRCCPASRFPCRRSRPAAGRALRRSVPRWPIQRQQQTAVATPQRRTVIEPGSKPPRAAVQLVRQASPSSPEPRGAGRRGVERRLRRPRRRIGHCSEPRTLLRPARRSIRRRKAKRRRRARPVGAAGGRKRRRSGGRGRRRLAERRSRSAPQHSRPACAAGGGPPRPRRPPGAPGRVGLAPVIAAWAATRAGGTGDGRCHGAEVGEATLGKGGSPACCGTRRCVRAKPAAGAGGQPRGAGGGLAVDAGVGEPQRQGGGLPGPSASAPGRAAAPGLEGAGGVR